MPYVFPQESGGRADASWVAVRGAGGGGPGLAFVCTSNSGPAAAAGGAPGGAGGRPALALFSASRHGWRAHQEARRPYELPACEAAAEAADISSSGGETEDGGVHVHLDAAHMGVGGDDSWSPSVHDAYLVPPGVYSFGITLLPLAPRAA